MQLYLNAKVAEVNIQSGKGSVKRVMNGTR